MKTNGFALTGRLCLVAFTLTTMLSSVQAQPDYRFSTPTHLSGSDLQAGAVYRYSNVRTGVDARVTIVAVTGGITLTSIDGTGGFADALQPFLNVPAGANGHVELRIDFVRAGTTTPMVQTEVPMTPIDVDGQTYSGRPLFEFDEIRMTNGYTQYQMTGGQVEMTVNSGWVRGKNHTAVEYPGIDTVERSVMFTTVNGGVSSISVRVGADNRSNTSIVRLRSLYFRRFDYPFQGVLSAAPLSRFEGNADAGQVKLFYQLADPAKVRSVMVERAGQQLHFETAATPAVRSTQKEYQFTEPQANGTSFYRLRVVQHDGKEWYSNLLRFESKGGLQGGMKVFPTVVQDRFTVRLQDPVSGPAQISVMDLSGRVVRTQVINAMAAGQQLTVDGMDNLSKGNYVVVAHLGAAKLQQQIIKQ